jgi:hypothetical protein
MVDAAQIGDSFITVTGIEPVVAAVSSPQAPPDGATWRVEPSRLAPHVEHRVFAVFPAFQGHLQRSLPQQALRLIALNGIVDPISGAAVPAEAITISGSNYRQTMVHRGCLSRHRAVLLVLLVLQELLAAGLLPPSYGVLGQELPAVMVLVAQRR